jgi:hypothetical protein
LYTLNAAALKFFSPYLIEQQEKRQETLTDRIRRFRADRISHIIAGETHAGFMTIIQQSFTVGT